MSGLKRTLTASDVEDSIEVDSSDSTSTCSSDILSTDNEWEAASLSAATGSGHRRYRSGSQPDFQTDHGWMVAVKKTFADLGAVVRLVVLMVTPMAARQFGSMMARRLFSGWFGPIHFQK